MIIHHPTIQDQKDTVRVSVEIEFEKARLDFPTSLWFTFPTKYREFLLRNSNGFAVCLLPLAMYLNEDIEVRGAVSSYLMHNLKEFQRILNFWHPDFSIIAIRAEKYEEEVRVKNRNTMSAFSGGVDSFYTLLSHLSQNESDPDYRISHTLFVKGLDRPLSEELTLSSLSDSYGTLMSSLGIDLVLVSTNVRDFYLEKSLETMEWYMCYDAILSGIALTLDTMVSRFYFPADETLPAYTNPYDFMYYTFMLDYLKVPLLSTDTLEMIYDGATTPRIEKIRSISKWKETYERLIVCWESHNGLKNCGKCEKCIRTMTSLKIFDSLDKYKTFPTILTKSLIRNCHIDHELFFCHEWNVKYALMLGKKELARNIQYAVFMNKYRYLRIKAQSFIISFLKTRILS